MPTRNLTPLAAVNSPVCIECDERPPNVQFQPCGHVVLCSKCADVIRKCPHCRAPIKEKNGISTSGV
ncbi:hypothetical protein Pelo_18539 [Pelomyxa schiedti]|nr:hypothetical protein Pelo_18539 [Pelomyxa schiedti]